MYIYVISKKFIKPSELHLLLLHNFYSSRKTQFSPLLSAIDTDTGYGCLCLRVSTTRKQQQRKQKQPEVVSYQVTCHYILVNVYRSHHLE